MDTLQIYQIDAFAARPFRGNPAAVGPLDRWPGDELMQAIAAENNLVSRFFAPGAGIDGNPVTGSAHCALAPFWAGRLGRAGLEGQQVSARGGTVLCTVGSGRVTLAGRCAFFLQGEIRLP